MSEEVKKESRDEGWRQSRGEERKGEEGRECKSKTCMLISLSLEGTVM
jgi:hypothetical protein